MSKNNNDNSYLSSTSLLSELAVINGDINCGGDIRIDGEINGDIKCKGKLVLGTKSKINGNIDAHILDLGGEVIGNVKVEGSLILRSKSELKGDINLVSASLEIEESAIFNGICSMTSSS